MQNPKWSEHVMNMSYEDVYDASYERVKDREIDGIEFFEAFYHRFLDSSDEVRNIFSGIDMQRQQQMLKKSFYSLLVFFEFHVSDA